MPQCVILSSTCVSSVENGRFDSLVLKLASDSAELSTLFVRHENQDAHRFFQWKKSCFVVTVWIKRIHSKPLLVK